MSNGDNGIDIQKAAQGPASVSSDGTSATQHDLPDQIEADRYAKAQEAMKPKRKAGLRFFKLTPPGAV